MGNYNKTVWTNGEAPAVNDTNLNNIEAGIDNLHNPKYSAIQLFISSK